MSRVFINNINTPMGLALLRAFRGDADPEEGPEFITTIAENSPIPRPPGIKKCLNVRYMQRDKPRLFRKFLLECDTIVYDLHSADLNEVQEKLKVLKAHRLEDPKTLVLISSVLVWGNTEPKFRPPTPPPEPEEREEDEEEEEKDEQSKVNKSRFSDRDEEDKEGEEGQEDEVVEEPPKEPVMIPFVDTDFAIREPLEGYERWKELEDLALSIAQESETFTTIILCAGIIYGRGELTFADHFKAAWLESPRALQYVGQGDNLIPTIHITDLCSSVKFLVENKPEEHFYFFAIDDTQDRRQKELIEAISQGVGTGEIKRVEFEQVQRHDWAHVLRLNVWMATNNTLIPRPTEEEEEVAMPFDWHCLQGIRQNILKLNEEFNAARELRPVKILLSGPPGAGKSHYSKMLSEHYRLPIITLENTLPLFKNAEGVLKEQISLALEDPMNTGKLPLDIVAELFRNHLTSNACRNRGFVLDGWPRTYSEAQALFIKPKKVLEEGEEEEEPVEEEEEESKEPKDINMQLYPQSVIYIRGNSHELIDRVKNFAHSQDYRKKYDAGTMQKRMERYLEITADRGDVRDFFAQKRTEVFEVDANTAEVEMLENLRIYIERFGRPVNYLPSPQELNSLRINYMDTQEKEFISQQEAKLKAELREREEAANKREKAAVARHQEIIKRRGNIKQTDSQTMRTYLMENLIPVLAEGMLEICKVLPEDPVDYLSEFVFKYSSKTK